MSPDIGVIGRNHETACCPPFRPVPAAGRNGDRRDRCGEHELPGGTPGLCRSRFRGVRDVGLTGGRYSDGLAFGDLIFRHLEELVGDFEVFAFAVHGVLLRTWVPATLDRTVRS